MYKPSPFGVENEDALIAFCQKHSFGTVISSVNNGAPLITHVPFVLKKIDNKTYLEFHIATENPQSELLIDGNQVGISVLGSHGYVSSTVYHHMNVPTYNYESVYLVGEISVLTKADFLFHLEELVKTFENGRKSPLDFSSLPDDMMNSYMKLIVGIRVEINSIVGAFKLSQNRNQKDFDSVIDDLRKSGKLDLAQAMVDNYRKHE